MNKIFYLLLLLLISTSSWAQSTVNPNIPAQGSALTSAPIRGNFGAAANDINSIYNILNPLSVARGGTGLTSVGSNGTCLQSNGSANVYGACGSGSGITALTGDVTASGTGSVAAAIAKIQGTSVSGTTGSGNVAFSAAPTFTGTTNFTAGIFSGALTISGNTTTNITGSTQCVHANSSGLLSGTGSDCGSGGSAPSIGGTITGGTDTYFLAVHPSSTFAQYSPATAFSNISSNFFVDPRSAGATCTGAWYSITGTSIFAGGTGWAVNDTFIVEDNNLSGHMRHGANATGHVTSVSGGVVTGIAIDYAGTGYGLSTIGPVYVTSGTGSGLYITITSITAAPAYPTIAIASGGHGYAVGDIVAIPNATNGNWATARVATVSSTVVTALTINNSGGDYTLVNGVATTNLKGIGQGLTVNVQLANPSNGTWDDTYGFANASQIATNVGGAVTVPDGCWVNDLMVNDGTTLVGQGWGPNYGYNDAIESGDFVKVDTGPAMIVYGTPGPNFGIDLNNSINIALVGFEVRAYSGYGTTACVGSFHGNGGGPKSWIYQMSMKGCYAGLGTPGGTGSYLFIVSQNSDYGANQFGVWGPFSDFLSIGDTFVSGSKGIWLTTSAGGFGRIEFPRTEYLDTGIQLDSGGGQISIDNWEADRLDLCALKVNATQVTMVGGALKGAGLSGTLTVTGAANNGSGLIRLTVTGFGNNPNGGATATSGLVTGDVVDVSQVTGTTEANGRWALTVIDGTHIDLQASTFTNAYISGGFGGVEGKDAYICLTNSTDFHESGTAFYGSSAGTTVAPAAVIDSGGSSAISMNGGVANLGNGSLGGYRQFFANWHNFPQAAPANVNIDVPGSPPFRNDNSIISYSAVGNVGIGTSAPNANAILDTSNSTTAILLPTGTTGNRPTAVNGMIRYNTSTSPPQIEGYVNSTWQSFGLGSPAIIPGAIQENVRTLTAGASTTLSAVTDYYLCVKKTSGSATTVNLPASPPTGLIYLIKDCKGDASTNNITITPNAGTIDGASTYVINTNYQATGVVYNGTEWSVN